MMSIIKVFYYPAICLSLLLSVRMHGQLNHENKLWYREPANAAIKDDPNGWTSDPEWLKALPVGNGFLGAMVFGGVSQERIQLNEKSLWSGSFQDSDNPDAQRHLSTIRELLFHGKYKEATELTNKTQVCKGPGSGQGNGANVAFGCFQTLGDLRLDFGASNAFTGYHRELDLVTGIALTRYTQNGVQYTREVFASYPDRGIIIRLMADRPGALNFTVALDRPERFSTTTSESTLVMAGTLDDGKGGAGVKYKTIVSTQISGGQLTSQDNKLHIIKATAVTLIVTAATSYRLHYPDYRNDNYEQELNALTQKTTKKGYALLKQAHIGDFSAMMKRVQFILTGAANDLPVNELMEQHVKTKDQAAIYPLYFQYGRYLLLSSSRPGSLPANLQGIWANKIQTPWNGDYHTDINVQMNYWPADVTNLSETHAPLFDLVSSLRLPGERTARIQYQMKGWALHPITNVWGYTSPGEHPGWGMHIGAGAWILQHVWEHYAFTRNKEYLSGMFPLLKSACLFYLDWLVKDPVSGKLVSGPSPSPENAFIAPDGSNAQISMGPAHDQQVIYNLFSNTLQSAKELGLKDDPFLKRVSDALTHLARTSIGSDGRLMEWAQEFKEVEPTHRHLSHLFALYPGNEISIDKTPQLAAAASKSLDARGDGGVGWTYAWKIALWARLHDGERALRILNSHLRPTYSVGTQYSDGGGSYYNLFDAGPPFQIDGNFGVVAGMAEMLLQSHEDYIELLPALPSAWKSGAIKGLIARGNYTVDIEWKDGVVTAYRVRGKKTENVKVKVNGKVSMLATDGTKVVVKERQ